MAEVTVLDAVLVALALADEVEDDFHLLRKSQRFDLDDLSFAFFGAALRCHADVERDLGEGEYRRRKCQNSINPIDNNKIDVTLARGRIQVCTDRLVKQDQYKV